MRHCRTCRIGEAGECKAEGIPGAGRVSWLVLERGIQHGAPRISRAQAKHLRAAHGRDDAMARLAQMLPHGGDGGVGFAQPAGELINPGVKSPKYELTIACATFSRSERRHVNRSAILTRRRDVLSRSSEPPRDQKARQEQHRRQQHAGEQAIPPCISPLRCICGQSPREASRRALSQSSLAPIRHADAR